MVQTHLNRDLSQAELAEALSVYLTLREFIQTGDGVSPHQYVIQQGGTGKVDAVENGFGDRRYCPYNEASPVKVI